jgi:hypothetical protein
MCVNYEYHFPRKSFPSCAMGPELTNDINHFLAQCEDINVPLRFPCFYLECQGAPRDAHSDVLSRPF